jgi:hypothetical protein
MIKVEYPKTSYNQATSESGYIIPEFGLKGIIHKLNSDVKYTTICLKVDLFVEIYN